MQIISIQWVLLPSEGAEDATVILCLCLFQVNIILLGSRGGLLICTCVQDCSFNLPLEVTLKFLGRYLKNKPKVCPGLSSCNFPGFQKQCTIQHKGKTLGDQHSRCGYCNEECKFEYNRGHCCEHLLYFSAKHTFSS